MNGCFECQNNDKEAQDKRAPRQFEQSPPFRKHRCCIKETNENCRRTDSQQVYKRKRTLLVQSADCENNVGFWTEWWKELIQANISKHHWRQGINLTIDRRFQCKQCRLKTDETRRKPKKDWWARVFSMRGGFAHLFIHHDQTHRLIPK